MNIFISHSSVNAGLAQKLCRDIEVAGHKCFIAPRDIRLGHEYASEIVIGIDNSDVMVLLLSKEANESPHILREVERAVSKSIPIILYKLEEVELSKSMEYFLMTHQWISASEAGFVEIVKSINELAGAKSKDNAKEYDKGVTTIQGEKKEKKIIPIAIGVAALVISVAIVVGSFILKSDNDEKVKDGTNSTTQQSYEANTNSSSEGDKILTEIKVGDEVVFGKYNNEDIVWYVLKVSEEGEEAILLSKNILTMKGFNPSKEKNCGEYDGESQYFSDSPANTDMEIQAHAFGENSWETSTIRKWLNSMDEHVGYDDVIPEARRFTDYSNGYDEEPGFLYNFTEKEREAIVEKTITTTGNIFSDKEEIVTQDKVFLLSLEEVDWLKEAGISLYAEPTVEAIAQDKSSTYKGTIQEGYGTDTLLWRLRTPVEGSPSKCYLVSIDCADEPISDDFYVSVDGYGIRPAITVDLKSGIIRKE